MPQVCVSWEISLRAIGKTQKLLSCFGMKRGPVRGMVACYVEFQCQSKFELYFCPDHWGGAFGTKLHEPSSCIIQT
jgi:hypothetical protein